MATNTTVKLDGFKRGDTPTFRFEFSSPSAGFEWSTVTVDGAMTAVIAPSDNTGAAAVRLNQPIAIDDDGTAYFEFTLSIAESKALLAGQEYNVEASLKQGGVSVVTPVTARVMVIQDYVI